ncbi:glycoside hydrolase family 9 protein [Waterburya agarophytonicola K14]|uniref:Glycoside hydrolase family 9 protein n=1 Tax=Waterburya agarophytonicola KI4 TaxID=2874699 RepID=A0A964BP87_9CYAN|nr:glycoside hydrolase family 9 protein [Waterburya agarophytonicola]MCC0175385.1 glycoside hydrolase family 9 protein [Waterburya agarophytonicola KI4]
MKFRWNNYLLPIVVGVILFGILFSLDSDVETLLQGRIPNKKPGIVVNQVGYLPQWQKKAFFRHNTGLDSQVKLQNTTQLIDRDTNKEIATFSLTPETIDRDSADGISTIDFSEISQQGNYYLRNGKFKSVPFAIGTDIYRDPLIKLLRSYYLQRCGVAIDDPVSGISHPPCHVRDGILANGDEPTKIDGVGGWHDGGSYNKYVATTTVSIGRLLTLYEENPNLFPDSQLNIPESGNGRSDLLDEMEFGLNWLLKMQRADGAVYRKVAGATWALNLAPDEDIQPRYVYGISTPETAKFAAVMAIASRNFELIDRELADKYLTSAKLAWEYLQNQPQMQVDWKAEDDLGSDKYLASQFNTEKSLTTDIDDRLWAAAELYITTGKDNFANYFSDNLDKVEYDVFEWKNPVSLGAIDYLRQKRQPVSTETISQIETKVKQQADRILEIVNQNPYNIASDRFIWGSNRTVAESGIALIYAYRITDNTQYLNGAIAQLDYLLGRNHFNQTFITDIGTNSVQNLSNLYTRAKQIKIPGVVVSGANATAQDSKVYKDKGHLSYSDDELSYATNGNATDYNAAVISLIVNLLEN